jgi:uncharacterized membrane protein YhaH (DUF805 family)
MITINCPHCGQKFKASTTLAATLADCTTCHQQFQIPEVDVKILETRFRVAPLPSLAPFEGAPGGINRPAYFFINLAIIIFYFMAYLGLAAKVKEGLTHESILVLEAVIVIICALGSVAAFYSRLKNMSVSTWWVLIIFIPILNSIAAIGLLIYPPRYGVNKKLDNIGKQNIFLIVVVIFASIYLLR